MHIQLTNCVWKESFSVGFLSNLTHKTESEIMLFLCYHLFININKYSGYTAAVYSLIKVIWTFCDWNKKPGQFHNCTFSVYMSTQYIF